jgi:alkylhydroperoxidase family enzyme
LATCRCRGGLRNCEEREVALLLDEIAWSEPLLAADSDPAWAAELRRRGAHVYEVDRRIAASHWLREASYGLINYVPSEISERLLRIGAMITAQENACRYCYGANRAYMKVLGYSESFIQRIERDVQVAEMDAKERAFIAFCRNLSRSRPRPAHDTIDQLVSLGFTRLQVSEMAFLIAFGCFYNRLATLIACPPERSFEAMANGPVGRLLGLVVPLWGRLTHAGARRAYTDVPLEAAALRGGPFGSVVTSLAGLRAAPIMKAALNGAFELPLISRPAKALMFAVVARALDCEDCEGEAARLLAQEGVGAAEFDRAMDTLDSTRLRPEENAMLAWARETVSYETAVIQRKTRDLGAGLDRAVLLEAIGVAALANATVRLAMLLE